MNENCERPTVQEPTLSFLAKHFPWLQGYPQKKRNAFCSFCRKSYKDVGPLVEGPDEVFICRMCVQLCNQILDEEERRRGGST